MFSFIRAIFLFAKSLRRIAVSLERIEAMYALELKHRGIREPQPDLRDDVEVMYGPQ